MPSFTTTLLLTGNNVGIEVPEDVVWGFGAGKRVPVIVTIAGYTYPSTIAVMGGRYLLPVAAEHRKAAGVAGGETHEVTLVRDPSPRDTPLPDDLADALTAAGLREKFAALAPPIARSTYGRSRMPSLRRPASVGSRRSSTPCAEA